MACLAIRGAMRSIPTAAMEVLLNLTPLDLLIMAEARIALYRHMYSRSKGPLPFYKRHRAVESGLNMVFRVAQ
jgi:hypothetical protein